MNVEIQGYDGYAYRCDTGNTEVLAAWLTDTFKKLMSVNAAMMPYRLYVYPSTEHEQQILSGPKRLAEFASDFSSKGLLAVAEQFTQAATRAKALEDR